MARTSPASSPRATATRSAARAWRPTRRSCPSKSSTPDGGHHRHARARHPLRRRRGRQDPQRLRQQRQRHPERQRRRALRRPARRDRRRVSRQQRPRHRRAALLPRIARRRRRRQRGRRHGARPAVAALEHRPAVGRPRGSRRAHRLDHSRIRLPVAHRHLGRRTVRLGIARAAGGRTSRPLPRGTTQRDPHHHPAHEHPQRPAGQRTPGRRRGDAQVLTGAAWKTAPAAASTATAASPAAGDAPTLRLHSARTARAGKRVKLRWRSTHTATVTRWRVFVDDRAVRTVGVATTTATRRFNRPGRHSWSVTGYHGRTKVISARRTIQILKRR